MTEDRVRHTFTEHDLAQAFTEWDRRYREEPERFQCEAERLLRGTPETYGEACAPYLLNILHGDVEDVRTEHAGDDLGATPPR